MKNPKWFSWEECCEKGIVTKFHSEIDKRERLDYGNCCFVDVGNNIVTYEFSVKIYNYTADFVIKDASELLCKLSAEALLNKLMN